MKKPANEHSRAHQRCETHRARRAKALLAHDSAYLAAHPIAPARRRPGWRPRLPGGDAFMRMLGLIAPMPHLDIFGRPIYGHGYIR